MINNCCDNSQVVAGVTQFTPSIPKFYWDVDSQEQGIKQLCKTVCMLIDYLNQVADQVNLDTDAIAELEAQFKEFVEHGFDDYYREQIEQWFKDNAWIIYQSIAKQVYFGLTDDGYFCAYVPDSWKEITFDTGSVYGRADYGRLILKFDAEGSGVIDNTYSYEVDDIELLHRELNETNALVNKHEKTLYTNLDQEVS